MELKLGNLRRKHIRNKSWSKEHRIQVVAQYLALGSLALVAATTNVPINTIKTWRKQEWWYEYEREIRQTETLQMDSTLSKIVDRSLAAVADRLEHGEHILNNKTGELQRKPVSMKDASKVATDLLTKRELLRGNATSRTEAAVIPMADQLKLLAEQFTRMTAPGGPVIDVETVEVLQGDTDFLEEEDDAVYEEREEGLQDGVPEISFEAGSDQET